MNENTTPVFRRDSVDMVNFLVRRLRLLIITGFVSASVIAAITLLIRPLFESRVILYPSSNISEARTLLGEMSSEATLFGDDDATEKLLQVVRSEQVRDYLKEKYDLAAHYGIKPSERYPNTLIAERMDKYIRSSKTSFGSVEIRVRDRDRQLACVMANDIASRADTIFNNLQRGAALATLGELQKSYEAQLSLVRMYEDSLLTVKGADELRIYSTLETETEFLGLIRGKYLEALSLSRQTLPYTLIVDRAFVAEKKVWPRRSVMVLAGTASVLLLAVVLLFIAEALRPEKAHDRQ